MWEVVNQIGAVLGFITIMLASVVYLYSTGKKGRQDIIRQDNEDLRASNQELRTDKAAAEATIEQQRLALNNLKELATQTPAVTKLISSIDQQQRVQAEQHTQVVTGLSNLTAQISSLASEFSGLAKVLSKQNVNRGKGKDNG